jgi:integrase
MNALTTIAIPDGETLPAAIARVHQAATDYAAKDRAASTIVAYRADFRAFEAWCGQNGVPSMPASPLAVVWHISAAAEGWTDGDKPRRPLTVSSIGRRIAGIAYAHLERGQPNPCTAPELKRVLGGIRRDKGTKPKRKAAATAPRIRAMLEACPPTMIGLRDRALLALGFAGAFRRSELVALRVEDLVEVQDGYRVIICRSKTDQTGEGQEVAIPRGLKIRPVEAVQTWLTVAGIESGYVFRAVHRGGHVRAWPISGAAVAEVVKQYAAAVGLDVVEFSAHSLRAGFCTSAAEAGASVFKIQAVSRHKSMDVLSGYVRSADAFKDHAGAGFL